MFVRYFFKEFEKIELVQLKLNITHFYEVKYALDFGGGLYPHRSKNEGAYPLERTTSLDPLIRNPHL